METHIRTPKIETPLDPATERRIDELLAARHAQGIRPDSERKIAVFGMTANMPHNGHIRAVEHLEDQGYEVWVTVSMGHVYKLHTAGSFVQREAMARLALGRRVRSIEAEIWPRVGLPIYTWDILTEVRSRVGRSVDIVAAVGPDINPRTWQGYPEIIRDGFGFVTWDEHPNTKRATELRDMIGAGAPRSEWDRFIPREVGDFIVRYGLYTNRVPERPDLTFLS